MAVEAGMLKCAVGGEIRRISSASVLRISLRLPVSHGPKGAVVELDGESWSVLDERTATPAMEDHFVFIEDDRGRRVMVVDRVVGLEPESTPVARGGATEP